MSRKVHGGRAMLNLPGHHSTAAIVAELRDTEGNWDENDEWPSATCVISDCETRISLDMDFASAHQVENSVHKIDTIVETLIELRRGLILEHHHLQDRIFDTPKKDLPYRLRGAMLKRSRLKPSKGWQRRAAGR